MDLDGAEQPWRQGQASQARPDEFVRPFHRGRKTPLRFELQGMEGAQSRMVGLGEVDLRPPDLVQRSRRSARHARQILDRAKVRETALKQRGAQGLQQGVRVDGLEEPAREPRRKLPHRQNLDADRALSRGVDPEHVAGQVRVNDLRPLARKHSRRDQPKAPHVLLLLAPSSRARANLSFPALAIRRIASVHPEPAILSDLRKVLLCAA